MTHIEAMKLILEALESLTRYDMVRANIFRQFHPTATGDYVNLQEFREKTKPLITALREALEKPDFWEGYVPEPVKPAQQALDKKAENARELGLDYEPAQQEPVAFLVDGDLYYPEEIDWETLQEQGHTVVPLYTKDQL